MHRDALSTPSSARWTRRTFLKTGGVAAAGALAGCTTPDLARYPSTETLLPEVDVHCHVFNVRDMPFYEMFVELVLDDRMPRWMARPLARFIIAMATEPAPKARDEIDELKKMTALGETKGADNPDRDPVQLFQLGVDGFIRDHVDRPQTMGRTGENVASVNAKFLTELYSMFSSDGKAAPGLRDLSSSAYGEYFREGARSVGEEMKAHADGRRRSGPSTRASHRNLAEVVANVLMNWAPLYSKYRYRLTSQLLNFVDPPRPVRLITPAILDVENWFGPDPYSPGRPTSMADQAELMKWLSLAQPSGVALHGFIGFDPLRCVRNRAAGKDDFAIVKQAIEMQGFVGIKLYPPMGFRATGNAELKAHEFPWHLRKIPALGKELDRALLELYEYCVANDVPIMAHCAYSYGPTEYAKNRAHPCFWERVLDVPKLSTLRLNLAHAGGLWGYNKPKDPNVWTAYVSDMLAKADRKYPNLYADVGDVANFLEGTEDDKTTRLIANIKALPPATKARLMYGTDWSFLGRYPAARNYRASLEKVMTDALGRDRLPGFFYRNAAEYLGLAPGAIPRRRIDDFYRNNQRQPPSFLDSLSRPPPAFTA